MKILPVSIPRGRIDKKPSASVPFGMGLNYQRSQINCHPERSKMLSAPADSILRSRRISCITRDPSTSFITLSIVGDP